MRQQPDFTFRKWNVVDGKAGKSRYPIRDDTRQKTTAESCPHGFKESLGIVDGDG